MKDDAARELHPYTAEALTVVLIGLAGTFFLVVGHFLGRW